MEQTERLQPTILVIFGITGDLSRRYLLPALGQIKRAGLIGKDFQVIGITRQNIDKSKLLNKDCRNLSSHIRLLQMDVSVRSDYELLKKEIMKAQSGNSRYQVILHLSVPPEIVSQTVGYLAKAGLNVNTTKLLLEKPFGFDLTSAKKLTTKLKRCFNEQQTYRIDHYLAKQMAQNLTVLVDGNVLLRNVWTRQFIEHIEIVVAENIGLEGRAGFYESTGALRDIVQSHGLQLAALTLMESTNDIFGLGDLSKLRLAALKQLDVVVDKSKRAQYIGYKDDVNNSKSSVETFVSLELRSSNPRWKGVPIRLVTGKMLNSKLSEIRVTFKPIKDSEPDQLNLRIQPKEGAEMAVWVKEPGYEHRLKKLPLSFYYSSHYDRLPEAYEKVLVDVIRGDHSLFASSEEILESWRILEPVQKRWKNSDKDLMQYKKRQTIEQVLALKR